MRKERAVTIPILLFLVLSLAITTSAQAQIHSGWKAPVNLEAINTSAADAGPLLTLRGSSLYFVSNRPGGEGGLDLWVAQRAGGDGPWEPAVNLGSTINTASTDRCPFVTPDDLRLIFASDRGGTLDFYMSYRNNPHDVLGWGPPQRIDALSSSFEEFGPSGFIDARTGALTVFFNSNRPGGPGGHSIYTSTQQSDGTFSTPVLVDELSSSSADTWPFVRNDGLELFLISNRPGGFGGNDIWVSSRGSRDEPWSIPVNAGPALNTPDAEQRASVSGDGLQMVFFSNRAGGAGGFDMYETTRRRTTLIPIAGSTAGGNNRQYRTSALLANPDPTEISGDIVFHPAGVPPSSSDARYGYRLGPYESQSLPDVMASIGATGIGSVEIVPEVGIVPASVFRIENGERAFVVPAVGPDSVMSAGTHSAVKMPSDTARFRTNVGVRTFAAGAEIWVCMHDADGTYIRGFTRYFAPDTVVQMPVAELMGGEVTADQMVMFTVNGGSAVIFVSTIDANGGSAFQIVRQVEN
jgi:hypothetical protein